MLCSFISFRSVRSCSLVTAAPGHKFIRYCKKSSVLCLRSKLHYLTGCILCKSSKHLHVCLHFCYSFHPHVSVSLFLEICFYPFLLCHFLAMSRVYHIPFLFSILYPHFALSFSRINVLIFISYSIICFIHISLKNPPYFSFVSIFSYPCFMTFDLLKMFSGCTVQSRYLYPISLKSASACCIISYCK